MTIGEKIRFLRKEKGITQKELAQKTGIAEITIRQYEANKYTPKTDAIMKLCLGLDCKITDIIDSDNEKYYRMFDDILRTNQSQNFTQYIQMAKTEKELDVAESMLEALEAVYKDKYPLDVRLKASYELLNEDGKKKAVDYVEDLSKIPHYQNPNEVDSISQKEEK